MSKALLIQSYTTLSTGIQGEWNELNMANSYIQGIQTSDILGTVNAQTLNALISGVPSPWARAKLFKYALDTINNPNPDINDGGLLNFYQILHGEWRGLLATIALYPDRIRFSAPVYMNVKGDDYNIASAFGRMLFDEKDVWSNQDDLIKNPDAQPFIHLIYYRNKLVGGTSPLTGVFTGVNYANLENYASDINWYRNGKFEDPTRYLTPQQLQKVYLFVKNLNQNIAQFETLINSQRNGKKRINLSGFKGMAREWENELLLQGENKLMHIGPIAKYGNLTNPFKALFDNNIPVYRTSNNTFTFTNAANTQLIGDINSLLSDSPYVIGWSEDVNTDNSLYDGPVYLLKIHDLNATTVRYFSVPLSEMAVEIFQKNLSSMLGYIPSNCICMQGQLNDKGQLVVTLSLQIDGKDVMLNPREYNIFWQDKPQKVIMWPNFISDDWTRYYLYSQKTDSTQPEFLALFKDKDNGGILKDRLGNFYTIDKIPTNGTPSPVRVKQLVKTPADAGDGLPNYQIQMVDTPVLGLKANVSLGVKTVTAGFLILRNDVIHDLTSQPRNNTATVGFDFGSNNTCVFFRDTQSNEVQPVCFNNFRTMLVGQETITPDRVAELDELLFFSNFDSKNGQFKSWLQEHDGRTNPYTQMDEIAGGVPVNRPNVQVNKMTDRILETQAGVLHYNMKWLNDDLGLKKKRAFIKSLWLQTCAFLFTNAITPTIINWSYPGAMMRRDVNELQQTFLQLQGATPIQNVQITVRQGITEAEAVCAYAVELPGFGLTPDNMFLGIDVGGSTSDILLLARDPQNNGNNTLVYESSIRLAAGVFFNAVTNSQQFRNALVTFHGGHNTSVNVMNINEITRNDNKNKAPYYLNCIFDQLKPDEYDIFYQSLAANAKFTFTIPAYVTGAILFYSGMLIGKGLKTCTVPWAMGQVDILPFGKGGRLFHWLYQAVGEDSTNEYYKACLNAGINCICKKEVSVVFRCQIATNNKTEVARGLCVPRHQFAINDNLGNTDICGEKNVFFRNGGERIPISEDQILEGQYFRNPSQFELSQLENFNIFMDLFLSFICRDTNIYNGDEQILREELRDLPGSIPNFITTDPEYQKALSLGHKDFPYHQPMIVTEMAAYLQKLIQRIFGF